MNLPWQFGTIDQDHQDVQICPAAELNLTDSCTMYMCIRALSLTDDADLPSNLAERWRCLEATCAHKQIIVCTSENKGRSNFCAALKACGSAGWHSGLHHVGKGWQA